MSDNVIYSRDVSAEIVGIFEGVLERYGITVPSPEDDDKEPENDAKLYGSVYWNMVNEIEEILLNYTSAIRALPNAEVVSWEFSGR